MTEMLIYSKPFENVACWRFCRPEEGLLGVNWKKSSLRVRYCVRYSKDSKEGQQSRKLQKRTKVDKTQRPKGQSQAVRARGNRPLISCGSQPLPGTETFRFHGSDLSFSALLITFTENWQGNMSIYRILNWNVNGLVLLTITATFWMERAIIHTIYLIFTVNRCRWLHFPFFPCLDSIQIHSPAETFSHMLPRIGDCATVGSGKSRWTKSFAGRLNTSRPVERYLSLDERRSYLQQYWPRWRGTADAITTDEDAHPTSMRTYRTSSKVYRTSMRFIPAVSRVDSPLISMLPFWSFPFEVP